ncbi:MAG: four helix bundle protein [Patescibacteria group bacterium]
MEKIKNFTDLIVWQKGHKLVLDIYKKTGQFPSTEVFSLTNQLRRAAVSITSNIAEGFSRKTHKEKLQFYFMALGSLSEVQNQLLIARDLNYLDAGLFDQMTLVSIEISKMLNGLMKAIRSANL